MQPDWENYEGHPEIGPLIEQYRDAQRQLEWVKQDLRTHRNIDDVMLLSATHAELKRTIEGLVRVEEIERASQRRDSLWLLVTAAAVIVGLANVLVATGIF